MRVRPYRPSDLREWQRMRVALWPEIAPESLDEDCRSWLARPDAVVLVAERADGRGLAGFAEVGERSIADGCESSPVAYLEGWFVDADARRSGVGRALVHAALVWARDRGLREMGSDALLDNDVSHAAHGAIGFDEVDRVVVYRRDVPGAVPNAVPPQPTLRTARLVLRPLTVDDAADVERLAGAREVADTTLHIPHPYPPGGAIAWIASHPARWANGTVLTLAVTLADTGALVGVMGLSIDRPQDHAELGYWIGVPYWNLGYATEAATALTAYAFETLGLHRVQARHFARNPASGRVMEKLGMRVEGTLRGWARKWERHEDVVLHAVLADEWIATRETT